MQTKNSHNVNDRPERCAPSPRFAVLAGTLLLGVVVVSFPLLKEIVPNLLGRTEQGFIHYRLLSERDSLIAENDRLKTELHSLKRVGGSKNGFEAEIRAQLEELQSIIEAATAFEAVGRSGGTVARKEKPSPKPPAHEKEGIASSLERPRKQNISFILADRVEQGEALSPTERELKRRVRRLALGLRALPMGFPVEGRISSGFGYRRSPFTHRGSLHEGMDISLRKGGDVFTTGAGVVSSVSFERGYGWVVDIQHAPSIMTRYAHLSKPLVREGQRVTRGDRIALSGSTGRSTGPHLHYEVRINGRPRDPKPFVMLAQKLSSALS